MQIPDIKVLISLFSSVNEECKHTKRPVVSLTDIDYYTDQISNLFSLPYEESNKLAKEMASKMLELNLIVYNDLPEEEVIYITNKYPCITSTRDDFNFITTSIDFADEILLRFPGIRQFEYTRL